MNELVTLLKTLANPTRLKLLKLILDEELCVCELQELLKISQPAVSQHIAKLKAAGLIKERRAGMWTYYQGDVHRLQSALVALRGFLAADPGAIPEMAEEVMRREALNRTAICPDNEGVGSK